MLLLKLACSLLFVVLLCWYLSQTRCTVAGKWVVNCSQGSGTECTSANVLWSQHGYGHDEEKSVYDHTPGIQIACVFIVVWLDFLRYGNWYFYDRLCVGQTLTFAWVNFFFSGFVAGKFQCLWIQFFCSYVMQLLCYFVWDVNLANTRTCDFLRFVFFFFFFQLWLLLFYVINVLSPWCFHKFVILLSSSLSALPVW